MVVSWENEFPLGKTEKTGKMKEIAVRNGRDGGKGQQKLKKKAKSLPQMAEAEEKGNKS